MPYDPEPFYDHLTAQIPVWAANREDLRAIVQVGSRARRDHPADRYSDADYLFIVRDPVPYLTDTAWTGDFGRVVNLIHSRTAGNDEELLVMYAGGYTVDYVFPPTGGLQHVIDQQMPLLILQRGARVLVDKDRQVEQVMEIQRRLPMAVEPLPSEEKFLSEMQIFWYMAIYIAKQIQRGDLLMVMLRDIELKRRLVAWIEIHARAGSQQDTWHNGRYISEWADPRAVRALPAVFPPFEPSEARLALRATLDLFSWLARESAEKLNYNYPRQLEEDSLAVIASLETTPYR